MLGQTASAAVAITWSAVTSRSFAGLSAMKTRPLLTVVVPPPAPIAEPTDATAGSSQHGVDHGLLTLGHGLDRKCPAPPRTGR